MVKIEIRKSGKVSEILIDGHSVSRGCTGWEVASKGGGFAELTIRFTAKETDIVFKVDDPFSPIQEEQGSKKSHRLFQSSSTKC